MLKKFFIMLMCIIVTSSFTIASAHDNFTWFGLRRNNTEVMFRTSDSHDRCDDHKCHKHKPKPKHKPKHKPKPKPEKKWHHFHKWWGKH